MQIATIDYDSFSCTFNFSFTSLVPVREPFLEIAVAYQRLRGSASLG